MASFGGELLAAARRGHRPATEQPLRHVAELPPRAGRHRRVAGVGRSRCARARSHDHGIAAPVVASGRRPPTSPTPARHVVHQHRHRVGQVAGLPAADHGRPGARSPRPGAVPVADQGARPRPTAGRARADRRGAAACATSHRPPTTATAPTEVRRFARERSRWLFSNPDMIHLSLLRNHARWAVFLRSLRYIVVDECHYYRGIFGSNVAMVLRRLLRLCERYAPTGSAGPTVIFASATTAAPGETAAELIGQTVAEVTEDGSPQGARTVALWEPELRDDLLGRERRTGAPFGGRRGGPDDGRPGRRGRADADVRPVAPRRRADRTRRPVATGGHRPAPAPTRWPPIAPGYLAEDRRALERALADGELRGLATTNALELGIDIAGLDAVVLAGFPGTVASFWQQAGRCRPARAGRAGGADRPRRPAGHLPGPPPGGAAGQAGRARGDRSGEPVRAGPATALRGNRTAARPRPRCGAWKAEPVAEALVDDGLLRRRGRTVLPRRRTGSAPRGRHPRLRRAARSRSSRPTPAGCWAAPTPGRRRRRSIPARCTCIRARATWSTRWTSRTAWPSCTPRIPGYSTFARELTDIAVTGARRADAATDAVTLGLVPVSVTHRVIGYLRRGCSGEVIDFVELDMPERVPARRPR